MKKNIIAVDLQAARRKAGLRQVDCAHLLDTDQQRISAIECGRAEPNAREAAALSLVYGKPMESLLSGALDEAVGGLVKKLRRMPKAPADTRCTFNRTHTLQQLAIRLEVISNQAGGGV